MDNTDIDHEFAERWHALAAELQIPPRVNSSALSFMEKHYSEAGRYYHTKRHIVSMLREADKHSFADPGAAKLAIFFHDVIYDVTRRDNEEQSALVMGSLLGETVPKERLDKAASAIRATLAHVATGDRDTDLVIDIDMAILAQPWAVYERYAKAIMLEYGGDKQPEKFREGRKAFLAGELKKDAHFITPEFKHLEAAAQRNISHEWEIHDQGKALGGASLA